MCAGHAELIFRSNREPPAQENKSNNKIRELLVIGDKRLDWDVRNVVVLCGIRD